MARAARVSGLLDKDFDDSWIVPARPRRPRAVSARGAATTASVHSVVTREPVIDAVPAPVVAPEPREPVAHRADRTDRLAGSSAGVPGRRTITIRGQAARPASRRPPRTVRERTGTRPDRIAMWAVLLGILLVLVAATSSHAAVLHALAGSLH